MPRLPQCPFTPLPLTQLASCLLEGDLLASRLCRAQLTLLLSPLNLCCMGDLTLCGLSCPPNLGNLPILHSNLLPGIAPPELGRGLAGPR